MDDDVPLTYISYKLYFNETLAKKLISCSRRIIKIISCKSKA